MKRAFILHGGAGHYEAGSIRNSIPFLKSVFEESLDILTSVGASEAVLHAVRRMEDHEDYNAGTGSKIQSDGVIRMTASYMDSFKSKFSSVTNICRVRNPIDVAFLLQEKKFPNLAGVEATLFAKEHGFSDFDPTTQKQLKKYMSGIINRGGTVGACALDQQGVLAAATSTGGTGLETPGRVSDDASPCGNYCTNDVAISATGIGETFIDTAILPRVAALLDFGINQKEAFAYISDYFNRMNGDGGYIAVTADGHIFIDYNTQGMRYFGVDCRGELFISKEDPNSSH